MADKFRAIRLASLRKDSKTDFDLYLQRPNDPQPILYRKKALPFTESVKERLVDNGIKELFVSSSQEKEYVAYCELHIADLLSDPGLDLEEKTEILYDTAHHVVHEFMDDPRAGEVIPRSASLVSNTIKFMFEEEASFSHFLKASSFDYYTYTHSVNVFVYCITLAKYLGFDDSDFLNEFGMGALLHDLGKSNLPNSVLNCPGKLSKEQWALMKQHPVWGYELLQEQGVTSDIVLGVTRHHHEKLSGNGYPDGIKAGELPEYIRITTVCDIFDALTTRRSYKNAINSFPALKIMQDEMKGEIDPKIFSKFVQMMATTSESAATA